MWRWPRRAPGANGRQRGGLREARGAARRRLCTLHAAGWDIRSRIDGWRGKRAQTGAVSGVGCRVYTCDSCICMGVALSVARSLSIECRDARECVATRTRVSCSCVVRRGARDRDLTETREREPPVCGTARVPRRRVDRGVAAASNVFDRGLATPSHTDWVGNVSSGTNASTGAVCARREAAPCAQSGGRGWQGRRWRCAPGGAHACRAASPCVLCVLCGLCVLCVLCVLCGLSAAVGWGSAGCAASAAVRVCAVGGPRSRTPGASWCVARSDQPRPLQRSRGRRRHVRVRRPSAWLGGPRGGAGARSAREPLGVIRGGGEGGKRPLRPAQG